MSAVVLLLGGAGVAALAAHGADQAPTEQAASRAVLAAGGSSIGTHITAGKSIPHGIATAGAPLPAGTAGAVSRARASIKAPAVAGGNIASTGAGGVSANLTSGGNNGAGSDAASIAAKAAIAAATEKAKRAYDTMSHDAKCAAADALNRKFNLNLDCNKDSFSSILSAVGGAAGAAAASFIPVPGATALGATIGVWAAAKVAPWCEDAYKDLSGWASGAFDAIEQGVTEAAGDVYDYVAQIF